MAVLAVIAFVPKQLEKLGAAIAEHYHENFLKIGDDAWLVSAKSTPQEVSEKLGITNGANGSGMVFTVTTYFGRANPNVWAWIKSRLETGSAGG